MATWTNLLAFISGSPGASWDSDHATEIITNGTLADNEVVEDNFAGAGSSTVVTIADAGNTDYAVSITPMTDTPSGVGEISFMPTSATSVTIYNTGSSTCAFRAVIQKVA